MENLSLKELVDKEKYKSQCMFDDIGNKEDYPEQKEDKINLIQGWICPRCSKVNSPLKYECDC